MHDPESYAPDTSDTSDTRDTPPTPAAPSIEIAREFLAGLVPGYGPDTVMCWQTFDDDRDRMRSRAKRPPGERKGRSDGGAMVSCFHATLDDAWAKLVTLNMNGAGVAVTINRTNGLGRTWDDIEERRGMWIDHDGQIHDLDAYLATLPIEPHMVVETSPARHHVHFFTEPLHPWEFTRYMEVLARFGGDKNSIDQSRTLRLPGTIHAKRDSLKGLTGARHLVRIVRSEDMVRHDAEYLAQRLAPLFQEEVIDVAGEATGRRARARPRRADINLFELGSALASVDPTPRKTWLHVGMALHEAGFPAARAVWDEWSARSNRYDPVDQERTWRSFGLHDHANGELTVASIYQLAKETGWTPPKRKAPALPPMDEQFVQDSHGRIKSCAHNGILILSRAKVEYSHDTFRGVKLAGGQAISDAHVREILPWLERETGIVWARDHVEMAIDRLCDLKSVDPLHDYLDGVVWDRTPRIDRLLSDVWGLDHTETLRAIARCWLMQGAARGLCTEGDSPHADLTLVIVGEGELHKSRFFRALVPHHEWFSDHIPDLTKGDCALILQGKFIIEIAEMMISRRGHIEDVRAFLTRRNDTYRPPWGRYAITRPRRCIFGATAMTLSRLPDQEGNRRYAPVMVSQKGDIDYLEANRDQIWAEAVAAYRSGEDYRILTGQLPELEASREAMREEDAWEDELRPLLHGSDRTSVHDCWRLLDGRAAQITRPDMYRIAAVLRALGFERSMIWTDGRRIRGWVRKPPF